ncbi:Uncharacterized membrane protein HdeD, DUF308 family [Chitinophaga costaii]|uniref:Uncharacterized membrane protein HdeD, DUF308 family n=1 Tax=Chitinophaga costaii TaxID=1335309 RepID=A0A1C4EZT2_9BACT|nr:DUF308 domain-containing protein [Chitinophaga costaii]PUZ21502.1 hypothetical protein DCM91_15815 [Chitinophaga costaii]SCC49144.1 Uncharacterized membrane protein HdeD, DUF308 family [Chitinophaga costaii]
MTNIISTLERETKNWWLLLITGIIFILSGIITFVYPVASYLALAYFFGVAILLGGIFKAAFAISNRSSLHGWGWTLVSGILDLIVGGILLSNPAISLVVLPFVVGFYVLYAGGVLISLGMDGRHLHITGAGWVVFGGIISLLLGLGILFVPAAGAVVLITVTGLSFIAQGITYSYVALKLEQARQRLHHVPGISH